MIHAGDRIIHRHGNICSPEPEISQWFINVDIGDGDFATLRIDGIAAKQKYVVACACRYRGNPASSSGDRMCQAPFAGVNIQIVASSCDRIPGFLRSDAHERIKEERSAGLDLCDGVVRKRRGKRFEFRQRNCEQKRD